MLSINRIFLGLDAECGNQRCQLLDVNHNQNSFAILLRKAILIGRCDKRQDYLFEKDQEVTEIVKFNNYLLVYLTIILYLCRRKQFHNI